MGPLSDTVVPQYLRGIGSRPLVESSRVVGSFCEYLHAAFTCKPSFGYLCYLIQWKCCMTLLYVGWGDGLLGKELAVWVWGTEFSCSTYRTRLLWQLQASVDWVSGSGICKACVTGPIYLDTVFPACGLSPSPWQNIAVYPSGLSLDSWVPGLRMCCHAWLKLEGWSLPYSK